VSSISKIDSGNVKALANIVINGELAVRGIKVMEGEKGLFVAMPSKKIGGEYVDIAHPITDKAHEQISGAVLESYNRLVRSGEKTLRADVPAAEQSASDVKVSLKSVKNNAHLKAAGQITIDGCFAVRDVKVLETAGKPPFVSMPSYKTKSGDYAQFSLPITKDFREKLDKAVLGSYQAVGKAEHKAEKNNSQKFVGSKTQNTKHKR
jgi:stage V sporulation protein G